MVLALLRVIKFYTDADCGKASEETGKDAEVENSDYFDEYTNDLDKLRLSKKKPRSCLNTMKDSKHLMKMLLMKLMSGTNGFSKSLKTFSLSEVCFMYSGVVN